MIPFTLVRRKIWATAFLIIINYDVLREMGGLTWGFIMKTIRLDAYISRMIFFKTTIGSVTTDTPDKVSR